MSSRYFCDGCGGPLKADKIHRLTVASSTPEGDHQREDYELCTACLGIARDCFNPKKWPRYPVIVDPPAVRAIRPLGR